MDVRQMIRSRYWWLLLVVYWVVSFIYFGLIVPNDPVGYPGLLLVLLTFGIPFVKFVNWVVPKKATAPLSTRQNSAKASPPPESEEGSEASSEDASMKALRTRYAKGQITKAQYEKMKKDLQD